jgi:hypothetical protein
MTSEIRQLRFVQGGCVVLVLLCIAVAHLFGNEGRSSTTFLKAFIVFLAIWSAVGGFTGQRRILKALTPPQEASRKSTPFSRWRAGHLVRLWSASGVAFWGLVLKEFGGPLVMADLLFATGLLLLLFWSPGVAPLENQA